MNAYLFLIGTTILWGLNYHLSKFLVLEVSSYEAGVWRYLFAVLTLFLISIKNLPTLTEIKASLLGTFMVGFVALFTFNFLFFKGMHLTTSLNAALIVGLNPAFTLILSSIILKTSISLKQVIGVLIAFFGILFLLLKGVLSHVIEFNFSEGDLLIFMSCIFFALHHVWVKKYSVKIDSSKFTLLSAIMCLLPLLFLLTFKSGIFYFTTEKIEVFKLTKYTTRFWVSVFGIGCLGTGLAYWLWGKGIELTNAPKAAIFINIVPVSAALFSIVLGEEIYSYHVFSALFILVGILFMQLNLKELKAYFF